MSTRWARFTRGWLAAIFATLIAAVGHSAAGGIPPNAMSIALALAFSGIACIALTGRSLSLLRTSAAVVGSQLSFHLVFSTLGGVSASAVSAGGAHVHDATPLVLSAGVGHHTDPWMWFAHALAAVLTIAVLRHGESAFWGMRDSTARFLRTVLPDNLRLSGEIAVESVAPISTRVFTPRLFFRLLGLLQHRGPPAMALA